MSSTPPTPAIVALGEPMLEFNQARADAPDAYLRGYGGDTSNMAIAASRLLGDPGGRVGYVTRVGNDAFGRMLVDLWREERVDIRGVAIDADAPTGVYFVTHGPQGHEFSYLRAGSAASRMRPDSLPLDAIRGARILHVSGISQAISATACDAVFAAIDAAKAAGGAVSYDPNLRLKLWPLPRARAIVIATIPQCDWFLPGQDEAKLLSGHDDADGDHRLVPCARRTRGGDEMRRAGRDRVEWTTHRADRRTGRAQCRCDGRRRLLRWRVRGAHARRRRPVRRRALCERRRRARDHGLRRSGAAAARCRRAALSRRSGVISATEPR